jgi:threonine dehydrogenase-like Zn-dependent dehydrogenase
MGVDVVLDHRSSDVLAEIKRLTGGGADVAIEALGIQESFEQALRSLRPGGTLSSLGVYSGKLQVPYDAFAADSAITASSRHSARAGKSRSSPIAIRSTTSSKRTPCSASGGTA